MSPSLFEIASRYRDGVTDPSTGLRVLRIVPRLAPGCPVPDGAWGWLTMYHQCDCFLDGGRRILIRQGPYGDRFVARYFLLDLESGAAEPADSNGYTVCEVHLDAPHAFCWRDDKAAVIYNLERGEELLAFQAEPSWTLSDGILLADPNQAIVGAYQGLDDPFGNRCHSRYYHLEVGREPRLVLDEAGWYCNHAQGCPANPRLFSYDRWPSPWRPEPVIIHLRDLDGNDRPLPHVDTVMPCATKLGVQRDHYRWTPDGRRICSYFSPIHSTSDDHYDFGWWISAIDIDTGEDFCCAYPPERWGCHFNPTPDSKFLVSCGGRRFQSLYAIDIEALREGWNERILCALPESVEDGQDNGPYHHPWVLPDQSGVLFAAGWPGPDWGLYLVEW